MNEQEQPLRADCWREVVVTHLEAMRTERPWPGATLENTLAVLLMRKGLRFKPSVSPTINDLRPPWSIVEDLDGRGFRIRQGGVEP